MTRRQIALGLIVKELGIKPNPQSLPERLILQKALYLAQQKGANLGYHFYWYLRGPYSRELATDALVAQKAGSKGWILDDETKKVANSLKGFFEQLLGRRDSESQFELFASALFAIRNNQAQASDASALSDLLRKAGKDFSSKHVRSAVDKLKEEGFLSA